jgi:hypothetical protein
LFIRWIGANILEYVNSSSSFLSWGLAMRTLKSLAFVLGVVSLVSVFGTSGRGDTSPAGTKSDTFSVIQISGSTDGEDIRVVSEADLADLRKSIIEEDKAATKAYQDAKKSGGKAALDGLTKPVARKIKTLKAGFKTQEDAEDWKAKNPLGAPKGNPRKKPAR